MKRALLLIGMLLAFDVQAQVWLEGSTDCGEWVAARKQKESGYLEHFTIGVLNGMALGSQYEFWRATGARTSREAVYLWLDNHCQSNPLDSLATAITKLFDERSGRRPAR